MSSLSSVQLKEQCAPILLSWQRSDPERRFGFRAGRFTDTSALFCGLGGLLVAAAFFVLVLALGQFGGLESLTAKLTARGFVPYVIVLLAAWSVTTLVVKRRKLALQRRALTLAVLPHDSDFTLTPDTAQAALDRMDRMVDNPRHFMLLNRVSVALSNLRNIGLVSEVSSILGAQAKVDEDQVSSSYGLISGFVWAIPVLGFIGTVLGLGTAMEGFGEALNASNSLDSIRDALKLVVSGLATAFDTTLVGLLAAVVLQMAATFTRRREIRFLDECNDYCQQHILARLRLSR
jgi:biopolymer transport protein ExbB/TolQ